MAEKRDKIVIGVDGKVKGDKRDKKATVESKPKPPQADDPRPAHIRNAPHGYG